MIRPATIFVTVVLCAGPMGAAPAPKDRPAGGPYFPTAVGATWIYECGGEQDTLVVTAAEATGGATIVSTGRRIGDRVTPGEVIAVSADGLAWVGTGAETYDPPVRRLRLPIRSGESWAIESTGPEIHLKGKATVHGPEAVKVPAGEFTAVRVDFEYTFNGQVRCREQRWYAAGVGEVKSVIEMAPGRPVETVLKKFTPGKV